MTIYRRRSQDLACLSVAGLLLFLALDVALGQEGATEPVIVAIPGRSLTHFPTFVALKMGFYRQDGLDVKFVQMRCPLAVAGHFSGDVDYSTCTTAIMQAAVGGAAVKKIINITGKPLHSFVVHPRYNSVQEMKGAKIAIDSLGTLTEWEVKALLDHYRLPANWFTILQIGDEANRLAALKAGSADGGVLALPFDLQAQRMGLRILLWMGDIIDVPFAGLGASVRKIEQRPDQVKKVARGTLRGIAYAKRNPKEAIELLSSWAGMEKDLVARAYERAVTAWMDNGIPAEKGMQLTIDIAKQRLGIKKEIPISQVADWRFTEAAYRELEGSLKP